MTSLTRTDCPHRAHVAANTLGSTRAPHPHKQCTSLLTSTRNTSHRHSWISAHSLSHTYERRARLRSGRVAGAPCAPSSACAARAASSGISSCSYDRPRCCPPPYSSAGRRFYERVGCILNIYHYYNPIIII